MNTKTATTIEEQIAMLKKRGMVINDSNKAKEILADIGYYRLGFYWFPFEIGYPNKRGRKHRFIDQARFEDAVALYYFDNDLRNILAFESQMKTLRIIRNVCAHGHNLYDIRFPQSIKPGPLKGLDNHQRSY